MKLPATSGESSVVLPQTIPVRYTEEEAEYLSVRPVVRQTFRLEELVDMVLAVTGKDIARIQQILRAGTIMFNYYRYWWTGFEAGADELGEVLARFPDSDPEREFRAEECTAVVVEGPGQPARVTLAIERREGARRRLLRTKSFWDWMMGLASDAVPEYQGYSYARRADVFHLALTEAQAARLLKDSIRLAPRALAVQVRQLHSVQGIVFLCPRGASNQTRAKMQPR